MFKTAFLSSLLTITLFASSQDTIKQIVSTNENKSEKYKEQTKDNITLISELKGEISLEIIKIKNKASKVEFHEYSK